MSELAELRAAVARHERLLAGLGERVAALESRETADREHDPRAWRRRLLRLAWRTFYTGLSRAAAARAIALDWQTFMDLRLNAPPAPGTREAVFDELARGGCRPLAWRQIVDLLDPKMG